MTPAVVPVIHAKIHCAHGLRILGVEALDTLGRSGAGQEEQTGIFHTTIILE